MFGQKNRDASIPVVVPIIISIVMVPMMVTVPAVPPIFIRVTIMAVAVSVVIVRSVLLVSGVNVNAEPIVCFGFGRCQGNQSERRQTQKKISFHMILFRELDGLERYFIAPFSLGSGSSLTNHEHPAFHRIAPSRRHSQLIILQPVNEILKKKRCGVAG